MFRLRPIVENQPVPQDRLQRPQDVFFGDIGTALKRGERFSCECQELSGTRPRAPAEVA